MGIRSQVNALTVSNHLNWCRNVALTQLSLASSTACYVADLLYTLAAHTRSSDFRPTHVFHSGRPHAFKQPLAQITALSDNQVTLAYNVMT